MAGRPVDEERRVELLDAVVDHAIAQGFAQLSWRPVAAAVGVSPTSLVHRFGTKEGMLQAVQARLRERILTETRAEAPESVAAAARAVWRRTSHPQREAEFRLFFAVYGRALQAQAEFADFLDHVVADWHASLPAPEPTPTLVIATLRGLLLDLLATGDRTRVEAAAEAFLATLDG